jgi:hypothetical protein
MPTLVNPDGAHYNVTTQGATFRELNKGYGDFKKNCPTLVSKAT